MGSELRQITESNVYEISVWCQGKLVEEVDALDPTIKHKAINIQCGDEVKRAHVGDTVIRNHDRTFQIFPQF